MSCGLSSTGKDVAGGLHRVRGFLPSYSMLSPSLPHGALQICASNIASTNLASLMKCQAGCYNTAEEASVDSDPLPDLICPCSAWKHPLPAITSTSQLLLKAFFMQLTCSSLSALPLLNQSRHCHNLTPPRLYFHACHTSWTIAVTSDFSVSLQTMICAAVVWCKSLHPCGELFPAYI